MANDEHVALLKKGVAACVRASRVVTATREIDKRTVSRIIARVDRGRGAKNMTDF